MGREATGMGGGATGRVTVLAGEFAECLLPADRGLACRDRGRSSPTPPASRPPSHEARAHRTIARGRCGRRGHPGLATAMSEAANASGSSQPSLRIDVDRVAREDRSVRVVQQADRTGSVPGGVEHDERPVSQIDHIAFVDEARRFGERRRPRRDDRSLDPARRSRRPSPGSGSRSTRSPRPATPGSARASVGARPDWASPRRRGGTVDPRTRGGRRRDRSARA